MIEATSYYDGVRRPDPSVELLWGPAKPAIRVASALDQVRRAPSILEAMRSLRSLSTVVDTAVAEGDDSLALLEPIVEALRDESDTVTALSAVHALARVPGRGAELELGDVITDGAPGFEEHTLWALSARPTSHTLARPVSRAVARGGLAGMHAQQALAAWARSDPHLVLAAIEAVLLEAEAPTARRYLVETMGLVPGTLAASTLERIANDGSEATGVRRTAVLAFSERAEGLPKSFGRLTGAGLTEAVSSVRAHRQLIRRGPRRARGDGVRVAQVHLGEAGGLATLIPQLGDALAGQQRVAEPITILRAGAQHRHAVGGHRIDKIELEPGEGSTFASRWPSVVAATRGVRGSFLAGPLPDLVHLRMADPGTYAAAEVARSLGMPIVFTLAPDPHRTIAAGESAGSLDRRSFAQEDSRAALWFRTSLVERLARVARELVLFPQEDLPERIEELTGVDLTAGPPRHTVIAEGIDIGLTDRAAQVVTGAAEMPPVLADLQTAISHLPSERHGLPIVVSAGRMVALKGMARLVEAFAADEVLAARANLVIVGGVLGDPSAAEAAELARIQRAFSRDPRLEDRVVLLGQRPHADVALVLAAARTGWRSRIGPGGSYACASAKEEFGLAIVEALAAGLPATAPLAGGPGTYIEPGRSGALVDTTDIPALAVAIRATLDLAAEPAGAGHARAAVEGRYTLERMARSLTAVYRTTAGAATLATPVARVPEAAA